MPTNVSLTYQICRYEIAITNLKFDDYFIYNGIDRNELISCDLPISANALWNFSFRCDLELNSDHQLYPDDPL